MNKLSPYRLGSPVSAIEEEQCLVGPLCDAWKYLHTDAPIEHYHLFRILVYFEAKAKDCWGGIPGLAKELEFLLEIFLFIISERLSALSNVKQESIEACPSLLID